MSDKNDLRERAATAALQGILSHSFLKQNERPISYQEAAAHAVDYADALIERLSETTSTKPVRARVL